MNKNTLFTKAIAAFLAVLMVFGTLVSLRGFSVQAEPVAAPESAKTEEPTKADANGVGHRVITQQVNFFEWKMKDRNAQSMELFSTDAGGVTYIGLWYDGVASKDAIPARNKTSRVWLAQDQYKNPGAFQGVANGKIVEYCDPRDVDFYLEDESNFRGFIYQENYGPNKNWWLKNNTYFNANSNPWDIIEKVIYVGTEGTPAYDHMITYFRDTIYPAMMNEYTSSRYFGTDKSNGCAIRINVHSPYTNENITEFIGADVAFQQESFGFWYKPTWHNRNTPTTRDMELYEQYLLPALVQCAIYAITSGNVNVEIPGAGTWPASHDMKHNQKDPWNNTVARRELTRTMRMGSDYNSASVSGSYVRMIVNEILNYAKNSVTVPETHRISYSVPVHEVGRNNPAGSDIVGPNGEKYGYKGVFKVQPPAVTPIKVTFQGEFYTEIGTDGSLTGRTYVPHQISGAALENFLKVTLKNGDSTVGTTPLGEGDDTPWRTEWQNQPKGGTYSIVVSDLNDEWIYLPGKTPDPKVDANGNVTITGYFLYNRTELGIRKNWKNNITGSTTIPDGASATFQLKQNGNDYGDVVTLNKDKTAHTWRKLPKYIRGGDGTTNLSGIQWESDKITPKTYVYTVDEKSASAGWNMDANPIADSNGVYVFTNTRENEFIDITVNKVWKDMNGNATTPDAGTTVKADLYQNGVKMGRPTKNLNQSTNWTGTWVNLPKYDNNGNLYQYTVKEIGVPNGWASTVTNSGLNYTITNTKTNEKYDITITKNWVGGTPDAGTNVQVDLYQNGVKMGGRPTKNLNEDNGWTGTWVELPKYDANGNLYQYSVKESNVPAGWTSIAPAAQPLTDGTLALTLTNTRNKITVTFVQEWYEGVDENGNLIGKTTNPANYVDSSAFPNRPTSVQLYKDGQPVNSPIKAWKPNGWSITATNMEPGTYTAEYAPAAGDEERYHPEQYGWIELPNYTEITVDNEGNVTITFKALADFVDRTVVKSWADENKSNGLTYTATSATVELRSNGTAVESVELNAGNNWTKTWTKLPKYYVNDNGVAAEVAYEIVETAFAVNGETVTEGFSTEYALNGSTTTITNTKEQEFVDVSFVKTWIDKLGVIGSADESAHLWGDMLPAIPAKLELQLSVNGQPYGDAVTKTKNGRNWANHTFTNLPKYDSEGNIIEWTIVEFCEDPRWAEAAEGYSRTVEENGNVTVKRYNRQNFTRIKFNKTWLYNGVAFTPDETEVTFDLYQFRVDGAHEFVRSFTLYKDENWSFELIDANNELPYLDSQGNLLRYFVVERGHDETIWTPDTDDDGYIWVEFDRNYTIDNGTKVDGGLVVNPVNRRSGDYSLDKTAKLTEDGTYTVTLTAQFNGPVAADSEFDLATYVSDTIGNDFHVASGYNKNNVKVYRQQYLGKDENGNDKWGALEPITVEPTVTTSPRTITLGAYGSEEDKLGLNVKVEGFDLEQNGCYTDGTGNHGYRLVVEITKVLANGDALGDMLPLGDKPLNDPDENRVTGICGIYDNESGEILKAKLRRDGEVRDGAMLIFPKPTVQIREMIQVYDFGLRQRNDDLLDFFGHGSDYNMGMGDIEHVLSIDYMYKDQTRGTNTIDYHYTHGSDDFEVGLVTIFTGSGTPGAGWEQKKEYNNKYIWTNTASHPHDDPKTNADDHSCFGYFEPKTVNANEFVVSALIEVSEGENASDNTYAWCRVKFMPATNVYYEAEQFAKIVNGTFVNGTSFVNGKNFANETTQGAYTVRDRYQNHSTGDLQHLYGYDDAYINGHKGAEDDLNSNAAYNAYGMSNGNALSVTLTKADYEALSANGTMKWPYVEFSFTGEAFDIIANANATSGFITVQVSKTQNSDGTWKFGKKDVIVNRYVDTRYFGAADDTVNYDAATGTMTQVPVLRVTGLENRSYGVRISAVYLPDLIPIQPTKGEQFITIPGLEGEFKVESAFDNSAYATKGHTPTNPYPDMKVVFDAIRVFNPHADSVAEHLGTETNGAYAGIKDVIRANAVLNPAGYGENLYTGGIYIDYLHVQDINQQTGENVGEPIIPKDENGAYSFEQYLRYGPNHEMYLKNGNAFAFVLNGVNERQSLHIAAKVPVKATVDGKKTVVTLSGKIYGIDSETNQVGYMKEIIPVTVDSATPMYYSVTDAIVSDTGVKEYSKNLVILQCTVYEVNDDGTIKIVDGNPVIASDTESILSLTGVKLVNKPDAQGNVSRPNIIASATEGTKGAGETPAITMYAEAYESAMAIVAGIKGDVDGDGRVTMIDALMAMRHALGSGELNNYGEICADMDGDTVIDMRDALAIIRAAMV